MLVLLVVFEAIPPLLEVKPGGFRLHTGSNPSATMLPRPGKRLGPKVSHGCQRTHPLSVRRKREGDYCLQFDAAASKASSQQLLPAQVPSSAQLLCSAEHLFEGIIAKLHYVGGPPEGAGVKHVLEAAVASALATCNSRVESERL